MTGAIGLSAPIVVEGELDIAYVYAPLVFHRIVEVQKLRRRIVACNKIAPVS